MFVLHSTVILKTMNHFGLILYEQHKHKLVDRPETVSSVKDDLLFKVFTLLMSRMTRICSDLLMC
jgi:hypothetical protein